MMTTTGTAGGPVDDALAQLGLERRVALKIPHFLAAPLIVAQSDLILTLPARVARQMAQMAPLQIWEPPLPLDSFLVQMLWHRRHHHDPAQQWVRQQCLLVAEQMAST